ARSTSRKSAMSSIKTPSGLTIEDLVVGTGDAANAGQKVSVHYTGWTTDGKKFDSSKDRGQAFIFSLGRGEVIRGWDEGVAGMKVGGKRKLTIPPDLGYGSRGAGALITITPVRVTRWSPQRSSRSFRSSGSEERRMSKRRCTAFDTLLTFWPPAPCARTAVSSTSLSGTMMLAIRKV